MPMPSMTSMHSSIPSTSDGYGVEKYKNIIKEGLSFGHLELPMDHEKNKQHSDRECVINSPTSSSNIPSAYSIGEIDTYSVITLMYVLLSIFGSSENSRVRQPKRKLEKSDGDPDLIKRAKKDL